MILYISQISDLQICRHGIKYKREEKGHSPFVITLMGFFKKKDNGEGKHNGRIERCIYICVCMLDGKENNKKLSFLTGGIGKMQDRTNWGGGMVTE